MFMLIFKNVECYVALTHHMKCYVLFKISLICKRYFTCISKVLDYYVLI